MSVFWRSYVQDANSIPRIPMNSFLLTLSCLRFAASALKRWGLKVPGARYIPKAAAALWPRLRTPAPLLSPHSAWEGLLLPCSQFLCPHFPHPMFHVTKPLPAKEPGTALWGPRFSDPPFLLRSLLTVSPC